MKKQIMKYKCKDCGFRFEIIRVYDGYRMAACQDKEDADKIAYALNALDTLTENREAFSHEPI